MKRYVLAMVLLVVAAIPAQAEQLTLLGGIMYNTSTRESSHSWQIEYLEKMNRHLSLSLSYLNEGAVPDHHRDGHAALLWAHNDFPELNLTLGVGAGPYFYFDTTAAKAGGSYSNNHGWGTMFSLAATWYSDYQWLFQVRANGVKTFDSIDTFSAMAGIGYQFDPIRKRPTSDGPDQWRTETGYNKVTLLGGQTIVNSFNSDKSVALSIEYRRRILRNLDGTVSWIFEGDNRLLRRHGISAQVWGVKDFLDERLILGLGAGAYVSTVRYTNNENTSSHRTRMVSGIVTMTASYRINRNWDLSVFWHRIVTDYDRDTDILLSGAGYRF